jgi:UDP-N-acetylmuramoyl-tripeptide--D-alanyl-D-alanine ligase
MNLIEGVNNSLIIDDTYNAAPSSTEAALDALRSLPAQRRVAVLGDMKELGENSKKAHQEIGGIVFASADFLITVGEQAELISKSAIETGFKTENVRHFPNSQEAAEETKENFVKTGDLILVKGSRSMKMERIVEKIIKKSDY